MEWAIRDLKDNDAASILDAFCSHEDMARQGHITSLKSAQRYVANLTGPTARAQVAAESGSDRVLALVGASVDVSNRSAWVFYWAHRHARNQGITTALVRDFCNDLLSGGLDRLELGYRSNNPASGKVAKAAGFIREGLERKKFLIASERIDVIICGRLPSDPWPATSAHSK